MHITSDGINVVPRIEETTAPTEDYVATDARAAFGLPALDQMLHGGLPEKSATLIAGSTGVGKSLLALCFAQAGAVKGEPSLFVTYSEPIGRLVARAQRVSIHVREVVESGLLQLEYRSAVNVEADDLIADILERVRASGARRVVVDGVGDLEAAAIDRERLRPMLSSLLVQLRRVNVTAVFLKEIPKIASPDLDFSDTPIAMAAENLLFLRHIEWRGHLSRILSVLKMRESGFDPGVREFEIGDQGIRVLEPVTSAEGLLTGIARASRRERSAE